MTRADIVVIGAGVIGCSIAYHVLRRAPGTRIVILEREGMPGMGSTAKATGAIRYQFSTAEYIRLTQLSLPEFLRFEEETGYSVHFRAHGRLFVTTRPEQMAELRRGVEFQRSFDVPSEIVSPKMAGEMVPGLRTDDLLGGSFCQADGSAEPAAAVQGYASRAQALGAQLFCDQEVLGLLRQGDRLTGVRTVDGAVEAGTVVIAAGPYSADVAKTAGIDIPARPYRRQVTVAAPIPSLDVEIPMLCDADTGFYIHRTGRGDLLLGGTDKDTHPGYGSAVDWNTVEYTLSAGARRVPVIETAQVRSNYVGLRGLTADHLPILGRVAGIDGLVVACGDNGKGFMHAPAVGLLLSELIVDGAAASLDLSPFRLERFTEPAQKKEAYF